MDFLDPKKKRSHRRKLFIGYALIAIALVMGIRLLVLFTSGYYYDSHTGTVAQNGLVFMGSKPSAADIYVNGELQTSKTDRRLYLPGGQYTIELKRKGYESWRRTFSLQGGQVE